MIQAAADRIKETMELHAEATRLVHRLQSWRVALHASQLRIVGLRQACMSQLTRLLVIGDSGPPASRWPQLGRPVSDDLRELLEDVREQLGVAARAKDALVAAVRHSNSQV